MGLYALQHRGQESAGVAWIDNEAQLQIQKGWGLVHAALNQEKLKRKDHMRHRSCPLRHGGKVKFNKCPTPARLLF